jgi:hypothetical protein
VGEHFALTVHLRIVLRRTCAPCGCSPHHAFGPLVFQRRGPLHAFDSKSVEVTLIGGALFVWLVIELFKITKRKLKE